PGRPLSADRQQRRRSRAAPCAARSTGWRVAGHHIGFKARRPCRCRRFVARHPRYQGQAPIDDDRGPVDRCQTMISKFFIEHPVLANALAIVLVLIVAICVFRLPVAQYPNIVPPTVQVTTRYPGASAQTVVDTIALPIELQVNGVPGMIYMQSTSA